MANQKYQVTHKNNDTAFVYTFTSKDGEERIVGQATRYCSVHGSNAAVGEFKISIETENY